MMTFPSFSKILTIDWHYLVFELKRYRPT